MKRRISLLLALVIVLGSFGTAFAAVPETAVDKAKFLETKGILKGSTKGDLMLEKEETRQNMVVMLSRLMQEEEVAKAHGVEEAAKFEDLTDKYYKPFVAWSVANNYITGKTETKFGSKENVTAQQYSIVLLRALGYFDTKDAKAEYENAFNVAKQLGLLEDTKIEDEKAVLTRDQMAVMIYNALETNVKGTEETLAQKLGIEMPKEDKPQELKVESVRANNLGEIEVTVSNGKLLDQANVKNTDNYRLGYKDGSKVKVNKVLVNEDVITLELDGNLDNNAKYDLVIRNMNKTNKNLNGAHTFITKDNVKPVVEKAEYLGKNGIKVTMSEPVGNKIAERNFLVDGKNVVMNVEAYGRDIILTPYGKASFDKDMKELTVRPFKDFAGILSDEKTVKIDSVEDYEKAPVVKEVVAKGNKVIVTFDKDVYNDSVEAYKDSKNKGNIEYFVRGRHAAYAKEARKIDTNVVEYEFERSLSDRFTKVEINGVKNHDDVAMEKHIEEELELVVDRSEPIVIKKDVAITGKDSATVEIFFDKDMDGFEKAEDVKEIKNHFTLFQTGLNDLKDQNITNKITKAEYTGKDSVKVTLENLPVGGKFILEVENFEDNTVIKNRMFREYIDIALEKAPGTLRVEKIDLTETRNRISDIAITFNTKVDRQSAENPRNYTLVKKSGKEVDLDLIEEKVELELHRNGTELNIRFVDELIKDEYAELVISTRVRGLKEERLAETVVYSFEKGTITTSVEALEKLIKEAEELKEEALEEAITEAEAVLTKAQKGEATQKEIDEAAEKLQKAIDAARLQADVDKHVEKLGKIKDLKTKEEIKKANETVEAAEKFLKDNDKKLSEAQKGKLYTAISKAKENIKKAEKELEAK